MLFEAVLVRWEDTYRAKWAFSRPVWLWSDALVPHIVLVFEDCAAFAAVFVLFAIDALVEQVVVQRLDLDDLLALPACGEHGTLPPIVDIDRLCVKCFVILATELADLLIDCKLLWHTTEMHIIV